MRQNVHFNYRRKFGSENKNSSRSRKRVTRCRTRPRFGGGAAGAVGGEGGGGGDGPCCRFINKADLITLRNKELKFETGINMSFIFFDNTEILSSKCVDDDNV